MHARTHARTYTHSPPSSWYFNTNLVRMFCGERRSGCSGAGRQPDPQPVYASKHRPTAIDVKNNSWHSDGEGVTGPCGAFHVFIQT